MQQSADKPKKIAIQYDGLVTIATATSRRSTLWKNTEMSYSDFLQKLSTTVRTKETLAEYLKLSKDEQGEIKDVGGYVCGSLKGGRRKADSVAWRQLITLDADFIQGDFWDGVTAFFDNACAIYSTHKHTSKKPRIRLIIPLSRPVSAEEYVAVAKKLADMFGIDYFDDTTYQPHRLMYWPSTASDGDYEFDYQDAQWLDPAEILKMYNDWRDPAEWPESSRQRESRKKMADKQGDPLTKPGMVGAFCRTYSITEAIETFLSDVYSDAGDGRYTFNGGSTTGGLVLYDDVFAYSHHGTDPVSEQLVNSYDLVRLHLFNDLDEDAKEGTPVNRLPSAKAMNDKVRTLDKVKMMLVDERIKSATEDFNLELDNSDQVCEIEKIKEICKGLEFNNKGQLEPSLTNAALLIEAYIKVALDTFGNVVRLTGDLPWRKKAKDYDHYEMWRDSDFSRLAYWLNKTHGVLFPERILQTAFVEVTERNKFNPVQDFIESGSEVYDGMERAERIFIDYLGADDTPYVREVTKNWLIGLVRRAWEPIKFDNLIVLVGPQGCGKSTIAKKLACFGRYFNDSLQSFRGKDAMEAVRSAYILEIAELSALGNNTLEEVKAFISKQHDSFRASYARTLEHYPRHCVFIGTTNSNNFLKDVTGSRRFWVVDTMVTEPQKSVHSDLDEQTVKLILGEVFTKWRNEEPKLSSEFEAIAKNHQEEHSEMDPRLTPIMKFLETPVPDTWNDDVIWSIEKRRQWLKYIPVAPESFADMDTSTRMAWLNNVKTKNTFNFDDNKDFINSIILQDRVTIDEILSEALGKDLALCKAYEKRDISELLRHKLNWQQKGLLKQVKVYSSKRQKAFSRPDDTK